MGIDSKHPHYSVALPTWVKMRDTYEGGDAVKAKNELYLPLTAGMSQQGALGFKRYEAYKGRAHFRTVVRDAIETLVGVMHHKPPKIKLPAALEPMRENATVFGEDLDLLLRRVNTEQLITGRCGLFVDVAPNLEAPYLVFYPAETIINWDDGKRDAEHLTQSLNLVVLEESEYERTIDFEWDFEKKYRVLILGDVDDNELLGRYRAAVVRDEKLFDPTNLMVPTFKGRTLDFVPFTFCNAVDVVPEPGEPPLEGLADCSLTLYRMDADYRQALFFQGQDTLVVIGDSTDPDKTYELGAGSVIRLPNEAKAEFIGISSDGIPHMREALNDMVNYSMQKGGQLLETTREKESSAALKARVGAKTASLTQIALAGAHCLEQALRHAAEWAGANPDEVEVEPNLDFSGAQISWRDFVDLMTAKGMGLTLSNKSLHEILVEQDLTARSYEEEKALVEEEAEADLMLNRERMDEGLIPNPIDPPEPEGADNAERSDDTDEEASDAQPE